MRSWRTLSIIVIFLGFFLLLQFFKPEGLNPQGQKAIAIFALCLVLWMTNIIPLAITSLLAIVLIPLLGVMDTKTAFSLFGNRAVFFILGAFIQARAQVAAQRGQALAQRLGGVDPERAAGISVAVAVGVLDGQLRLADAAHAGQSRRIIDSRPDAHRGGSLEAGPAQGLVQPHQVLLAAHKISVAHKGDEKEGYEAQGFN